MKTNKIKTFGKILLSAIYLNKCICCGDIIEENLYVCKKCNALIERISTDDVCTACGLKKGSCSCKYNIFRFNGLVCAFENAGLARTAYYSYKFCKRQHYANFFADEIHNSVKHCYDKINFDLVCFVPSFRKNDYNHSEYIAKALAQKLQTSFDKNLLLCVKKTKKQHKSTIKERLHNVDGKYSVAYRIDNKKILLIDDIKTTGATLDECTRALLFAGADCVYCATVLGTSTDNN